MKTKKSIIIVDDHHLVAQGISRFFEKSDTYDVLGIFENPVEALQHITISKPDVVLTDLDMSGMNGLELITEIRKAGIACKTVLLTMHLNHSVVKKAMEMKVDGYLPKNADEEEFHHCLKAIDMGKSYFSQKAMEVLVSKSQEIKTTGLKKNTTSHRSGKRNSRSRSGGTKYQRDRRKAVYSCEDSRDSP